MKENGNSHSGGERLHGKLPSQQREVFLFLRLLYVTNSLQSCKMGPIGYVQEYLCWGLGVECHSIVEERRA